MEEMKTGGPAFPHDYFDRQLGEIRTIHGLTIRDYFAAKAMQGLLKEFGWNDEFLAKQSYEVADAMLEARKQ